MKKNRGFALVILIFGVVALLTVGYLVYSSLSSENNQQTGQVSYVTPTDTVSESREFSSELMDFTIKIPGGLEVNEGPGWVVIASSAGKEINVSWNATNMDSLTEYFAHHPDDPLSRMQDKVEQQVNSLQVVSGFLEGRKTYFIYADYAVYILSTENEALYDDLDQIAKSFRYTP